MKFEFLSHNEEATKQLAKTFVTNSFENMIICLNGQLGVGKTVFVKGVAEALGIEQNITSPTFTIIKEYSEGKIPLFHMDVYRLEDMEENLGITDYFSKNGIVVIEWPNLINDILPSDRLDIFITFIDENTRKFEIVAHGEKYISLCKHILEG